MSAAWLSKYATLLPCNISHQHVAHVPPLYTKCHLTHLHVVLSCMRCGCAAARQRHGFNKGCAVCRLGRRRTSSPDRLGGNVQRLCRPCGSLQSCASACVAARLGFAPPAGQSSKTIFVSHSETCIEPPVLLGSMEAIPTSKLIS